MTRTIVVREVFPSRGEAQAARDRLEYHGFPLSSVSLTGTGGPCELVVRTHPEDRHRAEQAIHESWFAHEAHRYGRHVYEHAPSQGQLLFLIGTIAALGAAVAWAFSRSQQGHRQEVQYRGGGNQWRSGSGRPSRERPTAADLNRTTPSDERLRAAPGAANPDGTSSGGIGSAGAGARTGNAENLQTATGTTSTAVE